MAELRARQRWTSVRAASLVIHFDSPFASAVRPSRLIASFSRTNGRPRSMRLKNPTLSSRAGSRIKPVSTSIPASRSFADAPAIHSGKRILGRDHHARHPGDDQRIGTRRGAALMGARLQRHVGCRAARAFTRLAQCKHLRMGLAGALVPALAHDRIAMGNDAADAGVGLRGEQAALGEAQCLRHVCVIDGR